MKPIIYPYKMASNSARTLATALNTKRVYPDRNYRPRENHLLLNWGSSKAPAFIDRRWPGRVLNSWHNVAIASNKLLTFQCLEEAGVSIPEFTTDPVVSDRMIGKGYTIVARALLRGCNGRGISILSACDDWLPSEQRHAPLYVKYVKKSAEYRVHVFEGQVIDVQQKRKRRDLDSDDVNYQIRNHANGWVFCREECNPDQQVLEQAVKAVEAIGLDFGAVDIIWNNHYQKAYVLEINTAPGLGGSTIEIYTNAIRGLCDA